MTPVFEAECVDYLDGESRPRLDARNKGRAKDYKELLSPEDFAVFAKLRDLRKEISQAEAVPVYTIFANEQLAKMVEGRVSSPSGLEAIAGVGDARLEKYGARFLGSIGRGLPIGSLTSQHFANFYLEV